MNHEIGNNIYVFGPRSSGKTSFLAALAYWPERRNLLNKKSAFNIYGLSDDAKEISDKAENLIQEGASVEPTQIGEKITSVDDLPYFQFKIEIRRLLGKNQNIFLAVRDYPGEIFDNLDSEISEPLHEEFIKESLMPDVRGCLVLLPGWDTESDKLYSQVMKKFTQLMDSHDRIANMRIAVAMSKCERGELWPGRLEPEVDIFSLHLPKTTRILRNRLPTHNLRFFALSTFGVLHRNDPRPNRVDELGFHGRRSTLRKSNNWKPYGMISPLYWLSTGRTFNYV